MWQKTLPKVDILTSNCRVFMSSRVVTLPFFIASTVACIVQNTAVMSAELRIYQKPEFKRLRQIITVSAGNLCDDTSCSQLVFSEMVKIVFYADGNCTDRAVVVNTSVGQIRDFAAFGMDKAIASFAVLETSTIMEHKTSNVCAW
ncbi:hypothetical protein PF004_g19649 [Phytophthora fragariae]|uniref:Uncharacterized protein n=1 Tax=Phytophthora fragariae TaxID=53985 RepID=A0A6G0N848_9STRA|nr:hypothetical protein PF004_g19649 [Phytophthora fragariae]